ncbi:MAG: selenocysteine-specific translation elongation factor [Acidobacteria bacterium]|nr:MAG: selenocysteine-specific translation elongation factor [Acidobacteriota bacterium]
MPHVIVGTAGHIDHGKTALVKALTGIDADRLKEEKERGITIDIGFAHLALDSNTTVGFIDVPGHERFIKNMLAGVGGIDLVMLVIAADESVMPQTREHLDICSLLHIQQGFTVLTKIDKVDPDIADLVEMEVREFLKGSFLEPSPILRVSSYTGQGIPQLIETLREFVGKARPKDARDIFRLPVDRCFTMKGFGTVVTGTLIAGKVAKEQEIEILPTERTARVRGIQVHGHAANEALAGQRTALNLQSIEVSQIQRGMVLTTPGLFRPTSMFDCHLELLRSAANPIEMRKRIRFHIGTAELMGYVVLLGQNRLEPGQTAFAQIRLEEPAFALPGDRFIIRQYSPMLTIGGGQILDSAPLKHRRNDKNVIERLRVFKEGSIEDQLMTVIEETGLKTVELLELSTRRGLPAARAREHVAALVNSGRVRVLAESPYVAVAAKAFDEAAAAAAAAVEKFHETNPLTPGIGREELKAHLFGDASNLLFQAVLDKLATDKKILLEQDLIRLFGRKVTLKADEEKMRDQLTERFRLLGLEVPPPDEIISNLKLDRNTARKIIQLMLKENTLVKINEEMLIHRTTVDKLIADVKALKSKSAKIGVGEFKDLTGVSRKFAIPLLEYLDRQRVTRRVGDERVIL